MKIQILIQALRIAIHALKLEILLNYFYRKIHFVPRSKHTLLGYKSPLVNAVEIIGVLFWDS
jgi:hypothetical protein